MSQNVLKEEPREKLKKCHKTEEEGRIHVMALNRF